MGVSSPNAGKLSCIEEIIARGVRTEVTVVTRRSGEDVTRQGAADEHLLSTTFSVKQTDTQPIFWRIFLNLPLTNEPHKVLFMAVLPGISEHKAVACLMN